MVDSGFYPKEVKNSEEMLSYYAREFPLVEVDSTYHALPYEEVVNRWAESTPKDFTFDVKAFRLFTKHPAPLNVIPRALRPDLSSLADKRNLYIHHLPEKTVDALWKRFIDAIQPLKKAGKLGAVLLQFPPYFNPGTENFGYIASCKERLRDYNVGVEFRTGGWLSEPRKEETLDFLRKHSISLVCVDEPQGLKTSVPAVAEVTASIGMVRFHGRNSETWEKKDIEPVEKFNYLYSEEELKECAPKIKCMANSAMEVHVIFKNKYRDYFITNARQMKRLLLE